MNEYMSTLDVQAHKRMRGLLHQNNPFVMHNSSSPSGSGYASPRMASRQHHNRNEMASVRSPPTLGLNALLAAADVTTSSPESSASQYRSSPNSGSSSYGSGGGGSRGDGGGSRKVDGRYGDGVIPNWKKRPMLHEFSHEEDDYNYNNNRSSSNGGGGGGAGGWSNAAAERTEYSNTYDEMRRMRRHLRTQYRDMKKLLKMQHKSMVPLLVKEHARLNPDRPSPVGAAEFHAMIECAFDPYPDSPAPLQQHMLSTFGHGAMQPRAERSSQQLMQPKSFSSSNQFMVPSGLGAKADAGEGSAIEGVEGDADDGDNGSSGANGGGSLAPGLNPILPAAAAAGAAVAAAQSANASAGSVVEGASVVGETTVVTGKIDGVAAGMLNKLFARSESGDDGAPGKRSGSNYELLRTLAAKTTTKASLSSPSTDVEMGDGNDDDDDGGGVENEGNHPATAIAIAAAAAIAAV